MFRNYAIQLPGRKPEIVNLLGSKRPPLTATLMGKSGGLRPRARGLHLACALEVLACPCARPPGPAGNERKLTKTVNIVQKRAKTKDNDQNRPDPPDRPRPFARR